MNANEPFLHSEWKTYFVTAKAPLVIYVNSKKRVLLTNQRKKVALPRQIWSNCWANLVWRTVRERWFRRAARRSRSSYSVAAAAGHLMRQWPGGALGYRGGAAPSLRISRKKGSFFKTSACPRFCKRRVRFCTQVRSMGVKIPLQSTKYTWLWRRVTPEVTQGFRVCCRHLLPLNKQRIIKS